MDPRAPWLVVRYGAFLRLEGPFAYPKWLAAPKDATPMRRTMAEGWAAVYEGRAVPAHLFFGAGEVTVNAAPITERCPPTKRGHQQADADADDDFYGGIYDLGGGD